MTLPLPSRARSALRFRLLGFPVGIDVWFLVVLAFLGYSTLARGPAFLAVWLVVAAVSVLIHELGHALVARAAGARPSIELYGFGGVTTFAAPPGGLSRGGSIAISVAGPGTGLALGAVLIAAERSTDLDPTSLTAFALRNGIFVTLVWGVLNLLPILPLDGGNVLVELLPGAPARRRRLGAAVSLVVAAVAAVLALLSGWIYAAVLAAWFAVGNLAAVRPPPPPPRVPDAAQRRMQDSRAALWLLDQGRLPEARHLVQTATAGVDPAVLGVIAAVNGDVEGGIQQVERAVAEAPDDPLRQECLRRVRTLSRG